MFGYKTWQPKEQVLCHEVFLGWKSNNQTKNTAKAYQTTFD